MDGSPPCGGRSVIFNHNGLEDEEDHDSLEASSEDEESPPHLVFTDGSCSDSQESLSSSSPSDNFEECRSPDSQICASSTLEAIEDGGGEINLEIESNDLSLCSGDEKDEDGLGVELCTSNSPAIEPCTSNSPAVESCTINSPAVEPCTSNSPLYQREEVDMEVSSGDDSDGPVQAIPCGSASATTMNVSTSTPSTCPGKTAQPTPEERRRIEENIQALMREFERKRLLEKFQKFAPAPIIQQPKNVSDDIKANILSTSDAPTVVEADNFQNAQDLPTNSTNESLMKFESSPLASPVDMDIDTEKEASTTAVEAETKEEKKDDGTFELPSSSVEVPPVPLYEEIEQCIYRIESKKKAVSLMCFCRSNNMDCSDSRCDNRAMLTECPKNCLGKDKDCKNRRFAKREYAPVQAFYTGPQKGFGVQAVAPIKKGQFIIEYVGEVVSSEEFAKRLKRYGRDPTHTHHYMFEIGSMIIDATKKGNCSRFMNHSCEPNAVCEKWYVPKTPCAIDRIGFFAKRDIELGEEITFDYQFQNYGREAQRCYCGTPSCTGWIGKPPEVIEDGDDVADDESETESDETEHSSDEESKAVQRVVPRRKKRHRYRGRDNITLAEIERRLEKAVEFGCRNRTHVLGWIKLMTEVTLLKNESGILRPMHIIAETICSIEPSLQHIFVANGLPNIFKMWLRTRFPDNLLGEALDLKLVIIRSLTMMQSCADAINARAPEILPMITDLASFTITDFIYVKDVVDCMVDNICAEEEVNDRNPRVPLEVRIDRLTRAAIRLQAVLQQHANFRIPKKKAASVIQDGAQQAGHPDELSTRNVSGRFLNFRDRRNGASFSSVNRFRVVGQRKFQRFRISRWDSDYRPQKRTRSISRERMFASSRQRPLQRPVKRHRIIDDEPIIITKVIPSWPRPTVTTNIPPPPPGQILSPQQVQQVIIGPPPPAIPPGGLITKQVFPPAPPFPEFGPYPNYPVPEVLGIPASHECIQHPVDEFDVEECRRYYESYDVISLQQRLQSLQKEMSVVQSLLDQRTEKKRPNTPPIVTPKTPPLPKTPPPPPPLKEYLWRKAVDEDGAKYYYHKVTRESVWELPEGEESDPGERTPTRMPDTSGCGNDPESDTAETNKHKNDILTRWSGLCSPQVSTSTTVHSATPSSSQPVCNGSANADGTQSASQKKRDRERHLWQRFSSDADRRRAKKLMGEIEKVVGPIIIRHIGQREDATKKKKEWIIKQVSKEMLKRESDRPDFNFTLTEKGSKRVTDYASAFIRRKCAKEPKELWKGYDGSP